MNDAREFADDLLDAAPEYSSFYDMVSARDAEWRRLVEEAQGDAKKYALANVALRAEVDRLKSELESALGALADLNAGCVRLEGELAEARADVERVKALINRDKTGLALGLNKIQRIAKGFDWICEGRGPYEYDDDRYRMEVGSLIVQVLAVAKEHLHASGALADEAFHPHAQATAQALAAPPAGQEQPLPTESRRLAEATEIIDDAVEHCGEVDDKRARKFLAATPAEQARGEGAPIDDVPNIRLAELAKRVDAHIYESEAHGVRESIDSLEGRLRDLIVAEVRRQLGPPVFGLVSGALHDLALDAAADDEPTRPAPPPPEAAGPGHAFTVPTVPPGTGQYLCCIKQGCGKRASDPIHAVPPITGSGR